ncbi:glycosyltransferase family 2 protein [Microvirga sp. P5_D2]
MKNEACYIPEWVAYHRALGFDDIVIFDNESTDGTGDILRELQLSGLVRTEFWQTRNEINQHAAYRHAMEQCKTDWISYLDADEFLVLLSAETVSEFLLGFDRSVSVVSLNWRCFGSAGREAYDPDPTFVRFTKASLRGHPVNRHLKYFARCSELTHPYVHSCQFRGGRIVNDLGQDITVEKFTWSDVSHQAAQVNHYLLRSKSEYLEKKRRPRISRAHTAAPNLTEEQAEHYFKSHDLNDESDLSVLRLFPRYAREREIVDSVLTRRASRN